MHLAERAREILSNLEGGELDARGRPRLAAGDATDSPPDASQLALFGNAPAEPRDRRETEVLDALREVEIDRTRPLDALELLASWQRALRDEEAS